MKIVVLAINRFTSPTGICRYAANLCRSLSGRPEIQELSLVVGCWQKDYFRGLLGGSKEINLIPVAMRNRSISRNIWYWRSAARLAAELGTDILHCSFPVPISRSLFSGSIVTTVHDFYPFECPENFGSSTVVFNRMFCRQALRTSDGVVCDSQETLKALHRLFPGFATSKVSAVVPCAVDFKGVSQREPRGTPSVVKSRFILSVAQHRQNKNLDLLVRAYSLLRANVPGLEDIPLLIVGAEGPQTEHITALARNMAPLGSVIFRSDVSDQELAWLYSNCRMLVVPSSQEGFCFPLVEGMHFGARIVASDIPVLREVGSNQCTYFALQDGSEGLCAAMGVALQAPQGIVDHRLALSRFTPEAIAAEQLNVYNRIRRSSDLIQPGDRNREHAERITQEQC
jgi:glycosyltransferase involved in cell wall biosynthesis